MGGTLSGIIFVLGITIVAGGIAYIGDRVGHQVGRKRLTLFGLRPKYTSTIVAVATGMLIALSVTLIAIVSSNLVRTAFFRLGQLNTQIAQLQAQELAAQSELRTTRDKRMVVAVQTLIPNVAPMTIDPAQPDSVVLPQMTGLFEQTATAINRAFPSSTGLRPFRKRADAPETQAGLRKELANIRNVVAAGQYPADTPVLLVPVISQNLFPGDGLTFAFSHWVDHRIAAAGERLASVPVQGGTTPSLIVLQNLTNLVVQRVSGKLPPAYAVNVGINAPQLQAALNQLPHLRGSYTLVAKSSIDLYPHSGGVLLDFSLVSGK